MIVALGVILASVSFFSLIAWDAHFQMGGKLSYNLARATTLICIILGVLEITLIVVEFSVDKYKEVTLHNIELKKVKNEL